MIMTFSPSSITKYLSIDCKLNVKYPESED